MIAAPSTGGVEMSETINEAEAQEFLSKLDRELRTAIPDHLPIGLDLPDDWTEPVNVLDLIQAEIAEGRPVLRKVRVADGEADRLTGMKRVSSGTSAELTGSERYTAVEALSLTTEALALVFVSPVQMASKVMSTLSKFSAVGVDDVSIKFAAEKEYDSSPVLELDALTINAAVEAAVPLANVLGELQGNLEANWDLTLGSKK
jgi:hypothetical protein